MRERDSACYDELLGRFTYKWVAIRGDSKDASGSQNSPYISPAEWLQYHAKSLAKGTIEREVNFLSGIILDVIDLDRSGNIDLLEWQSLFQVSGIPIIYPGEAFSKIDRDRDGRLDREEIVPLLRDFYLSKNPDAIGNYFFGPF